MKKLELFYAENQHGKGEPMQRTPEVFITRSLDPCFAIHQMSNEELIDKIRSVEIHDDAIAPDHDWAFSYRYELVYRANMFPDRDLTLEEERDLKNLSHKAAKILRLDY